MMDGAAPAAGELLLRLCGLCKDDKAGRALIETAKHEELSGGIALLVVSAQDMEHGIARILMSGIYGGDAGFLIDHHIRVILPLDRDKGVGKGGYRRQTVDRHGGAGLQHLRRRGRRGLRHRHPPRADETLRGGARATGLCDDQVEQGLLLLSAVSLLSGRGIDGGGEATG